MEDTTKDLREYVTALHGATAALEDMYRRAQGQLATAAHARERVFSFVLVSGTLVSLTILLCIYVLLIVATLTARKTLPPSYYYTTAYATIVVVVLVSSLALVRVLRQ